MTGVEDLSDIFHEASALSKIVLLAPLATSMIFSY